MNAPPSTLLSHPGVEIESSLRMQAAKTTFSGLSAATNRAENSAIAGFGGRRPWRSHRAQSAPWLLRPTPPAYSLTPPQPRLRPAAFGCCARSLVEPPAGSGRLPTCWPTPATRGSGRAVNPELLRVVPRDDTVASAYASVEWVQYLSTPLAV